MMASITPLGERGRGNRWWRTAAALTAGSVLGGWALGLGAGALGRLAAVAAGQGVLGDRAAAALAGGVVVAGGIVELAGVRLPTWRRQVRDDWLGRYRGWVYGGGFGVQLGVAVATTVTTAAVYAAAALLVVVGATGDLAGAQAAGAAFGLARALPVLAGARVHEPEQLRRRVRRVAAAARTSRVAAGGALCLAGLAVVAGA